MHHNAVKPGYNYLWQSEIHIISNAVKYTFCNELLIEYSQWIYQTFNIKLSEYPLENFMQKYRSVSVH